MNREVRPWLVLALLVPLALSGCGVSKAELSVKEQEAATAKQEAAAAKQEATRLQQQLTADEQQISQLKDTVATAQKAMTDDQKSQVDEASRAMKEAQERAKILELLSTQLKKTIDAGNLKVTTRHGRIVLQLHNDILFDKGEADVKPAAKNAMTEVASGLRAVGGRRFQVAGHTDMQPITTDKKKQFPTNWELSTARAISVVKMLTRLGVDPSVLSAAGYGPYDPVASNATPEGMAKNRRIEITVVPNVADLVKEAKEVGQEAKDAQAAASTPAPSAQAASH